MLREPSTLRSASNSTCPPAIRTSSRTTSPPNQTSQVTTGLFDPATADKNASDTSRNGRIPNRISPRTRRINRQHIIPSELISRERLLPVIPRNQRTNNRLRRRLHLIHRERP